MSLPNALPEAMRLFMSYLEEQAGKEIRLILANGFMKGTLEHAPNDPKNAFTLSQVSHYSPTGEKQELDQVVLIASQVIGWGSDSWDFLDAKEGGE